MVNYGTTMAIIKWFQKKVGIDKNHKTEDNITLAYYCIIQA